jgi:tRNA (uracil-5-)-methyltransferase TRM9
VDEYTIRRLNVINREFYASVAEDFDTTRGKPWPGWQRLLPLLHLPLSVLDAGCGNGRLGVFLAQRLGTSIQYHGIDSNPALIEHARQSLQHIETQFELRDIVEQPPDAGQYDLAALLGVLHHIPGAERRRALIRTLAERVAPDGLLVFTCWRFYEYPRFRDRIVPMPADLSAEPDDYLLDWRRGANALRYCHYVDDAELAQLIDASGLRLVLQYRADGQSGDMNLYVVLQAH